MAVCPEQNPNFFQRKSGHRILIISARAGKKEGGWRVDVHQEFLPALAFPPPPNFVPAKLARRL